MSVPTCILTGPQKALVFEVRLRSLIGDVQARIASSSLLISNAEKKAPLKRGAVDGLLEKLQLLQQREYRLR